MDQETIDRLKKMYLDEMRKRHGPDYEFPKWTEEERRRSMALINTITAATDDPNSEWTAEEIIRRAG